MKISRRSWHYKISNLFAYGEPRSDNLCKYFWRGVGKIFLSLVVLIVLLALVTVALTEPMFVAVVIAMVSIITIVVGPIFVISWLRDKFKGGEPIGENEFENVIKAYVKSQKDKVCPRIEYVD